MQYPEVKIVFLSSDNDWTSLFDKLDLKCNHHKNNLGTCKSDPKCENENRYVCDIKIPYFHSFDIFKFDFDLLIRGQRNMFDASNLRNTIKNDFSEKIQVGSNYGKTQCSRLNKLALVVEEEIPQAYLNAYALYVCGFRAWPVCSCLEFVNLPEQLEHSKSKSQKCMVVRDYDLQYEDYDSMDAGKTVSLHDLRGLKKEFFI